MIEIYNFCKKNMGFNCCRVVLATVYNGKFLCDKVRAAVDNFLHLPPIHSSPILFRTNVTWHRRAKLIGRLLFNTKDNAQFACAVSANVNMFERKSLREKWIIVSMAERLTRYRSTYKNQTPAKSEILHIQTSRENLQLSVMCNRTS